MSNPHVLVVDDDESMCHLVADLLKPRGFAVTACTQPEEALSILDNRDTAVVLTDLNMEGMDGLELCQRVVGARPDVPVVVITAFGSLDTAVGAIRAGAYDFITKPFESEHLVIAVQRAARHFALQGEVKRLRDLVKEQEGLPETIIGQSAPMRRMFDMLDRVADNDMTVLIYGQTGTGKELVARALHDRSRRRNGPFVAINCAAMPSELLESELFGHKKGSFTGAHTDRKGLLLQAQGGTLLLDEIGEMPLEMQAKLLRALQEHTVRPVGDSREIPFDARIIAATNRDLESEVEEGRFREDLFYRINVLGLDVPPLRDRGNDVLLLAQSFIDRLSAQLGKEVKGLSTAAAEKILVYEWPGNVRELENAMARAVALTRHEEIVVDDLPEPVRNYRRDSFILPTGGPSELLSMDDVESRYIRKVLDAVGGNKTQAARILGFDRRTLYRKMERYGIEEGSEEGLEV